MLLGRISVLHLFVYNFLEYVSIGLLGFGSIQVRFLLVLVGFVNGLSGSSNA